MGVYLRVDIPLITTAGIYHNPDLGLISLSSDGSTWLTIADKNLGATQVYNDGDTLSEANSGKYYQWGNNYGFPFTGPTTTSSTQVNAQNYGPGNYYNSSTFIIRNSYPYGWDSSNNANLWGDTTNTNIARQGPCDNGYHVPTHIEFSSIIDIGINIGAWASSGGHDCSIKLKIPFAGRIVSDGNIYDKGTDCFYWFSDVYQTETRYFIGIRNSSIQLNSGTTASGYNIRPFKNDAAQPDGSWTVLYQPS